MKYKFDIFSLIVTVAVLVILGIGALMLGSFSDSFGDELQDSISDSGMNQTNMNISTNFIANDSQQFTDNYFFWFLVATFIGIIILGLYLEFEPATMIIIFIVGSIIVGASWLGGSIYTGFLEDVDGSANMTKTNVLLNSTYFPIFILVCLIILVIIMYNRKGGGFQ